MKEIPTYTSVSTDLNTLISLISLTKQTKGVYPTKEELMKGMKVLGVDYTEEVKEGIKSHFPDYEYE